MENNLAEKLTSYNPVTKRWCCAMYGEGYWTGGFFAKTKEIAEKLALENFKRNVDSTRGVKAAKAGETVEYVTF